jgi:hypothetical protein
MVYQFPGGKLNNEYWCCHDNTKGHSWSSMMNFNTLYNPNQDFSNGMSIAVNLYIYRSGTDYDYYVDYNGLYYSSGSTLTNNVGIFYYGSDPSNLSNSLYIKYTSKDFNVTCNGITSSINPNSNMCTSGHNDNNNGGSNRYSMISGASRMLFVFYPTGYMHLWIDQFRFTPAIGIYVGFNNNFNKNGVWLGALNNSSFYGVISNLRIYNKPMHWDQVYAI